MFCMVDIIEIGFIGLVRMNKYGMPEFIQVVDS